MHFADGQIPVEYTRHLGVKRLVLLLLLTALVLALIASIAAGSAAVPFASVVKVILGLDAPQRHEIIVRNIRLPQALTAVIAGCGLAAAGCVMQSILRNPLGSPFTLGISHAAAFGAAFSVLIFHGGVIDPAGTTGNTVTHPYLTTATAFGCSLLAALVIIGVARMRGATPEVMVLTGVALGSLFTAGTMFLQFFADDTQLAAMVFWTFGDTGRASWTELGFMATAVVVCSLYFLANSWGYNAIDAGDETAMGLGVNVNRLRLIGMMLASLLTACVIGFLGIIGFVGLVIPHMMRRLVGADHRYLLPASILAGGLLLLLSDTAARLIMAPHLLPVSVLTAFLGAPVFLYLIIWGQRR